MPFERINRSTRHFLHSGPGGLAAKPAGQAECIVFILAMRFSVIALVRLIRSHRLQFTTKLAPKFIKPPSETL